MSCFSVILALAVVSACAGSIADGGTPGGGSASDDGSGSGDPGNGGPQDGGSGDGGPGAGDPNRPAVTVDGVRVIPGDMAIVTVTLNSAPADNLMFTYKTADGSALAGTHYTGVTSGSAMIAQGQLSADIAIATSSTPGVLYLGKKFFVTLTFPTDPSLNRTAAVAFSAAPPATGTHVLKNRWAAFPANATTPAARRGHAAIWTGKKLIIWGGYLGASFPFTYLGGAAYDPETNNWTAISSIGAPSARSSPVAVWTGAKMIIWGGYNDTERWKNDGGVYDPATDTWSVLPQNGAIPAVREAAAGVWTGSKMIIWGGYAPGAASGPFLGDGAAYDPRTGTWVAIAAANAPSLRTLPLGVWTGNKMIVWSGVYAARPIVDGIYNYYNDGAAYDPVANTWTPISSAGAPTPRAYSSAAWTGTQMLVWGGVDASIQYRDGGLYDPGANAWHSLSVSDAPSIRAFGASAWTGNSFIYWGGVSPAGLLNDGGIYY